MGPDDRLYAVTEDGLTSWNTGTGMANDKKAAATAFRAADFVITQKGFIYLLHVGVIEMIDSAGHTPVAGPFPSFEFGAEGLGMPSGLALSPDQSMLVVTDSYPRYSWSFQIAAGGALENGEPYYRMEMPETETAIENGPQSAAEDTDGMVYFATPLGIQVAMQNGRIVEILNSPTPDGGPLTAITFAGNGDQNWLYVAQGGKLFRRPVKVTGANAWTVVKPPKPTL